MRKSKAALDPGLDLTENRAVVRVAVAHDYTAVAHSIEMKGKSLGQKRIIQRCGRKVV